MSGRARRPDSGASTAEFVVMTPLLFAIFLFVIGLGRMASAHQEVQDLAGEAARAASLERNTSLAAGRGEEIVRASLQNRGLSCAQLTVDIDVSSYRPGGVVRADVTCTADLSDVVISGLPGTKTFTGSATIPIEEYRSR
ncbi:MAG: TadE/TadG family type IV pilus assembly protein [Aeromicrobium sp.]|uniref:TadE/TadG family type IV pilus assembly protein n=1 Tax=Aeromicrobium sp. TaxID=1871063 RepID=UPI002624B145|nr:TadE/TadG family type IV pilus assembly protein [Aeromicrobium sp.]MDF1705821.1 TadE/TadG family type IV pilus assembly protein [Aeromicrobium sp.]